MADEHRTLRGPICYGHEQVHPRTNLRRVKDSEKEYEIGTSSHGLTKREYFAAMALQAVDIQAHVATPAAKNIARSAVEIADALIDALNQEAK
jgi:hypothetical protein